MVRGVPIAGAPFVALVPAYGPRLYLPLADWADAHPETGVHTERLPGGPIATVHGVPFEGLVERVQQLCALLAPNSGLRAPAEFQAGIRGTGELRLPLRTLPLARPRDFVLADPPDHALATHAGVTEASNHLRPA